MPNVVPSQIIEFLKVRLSEPQDFDLSVVKNYPGFFAGFVALCDQLSPHLLRLSAKEYAEFATAIETIRFGMDRYRYGDPGAALTPVGRALNHAWRIVATLPDSAPSAAHDLAFLNDAVMQDLIGSDIAAVDAGLLSGEWKGATILAGSACEALLLIGLQQRETKTNGTIAAAVAAITWGRKQPNAGDLTDRSWDLFSYTKVAHHLKLISDTTEAELEPTRDYRNLIHPAKTVREKMQCDRGTALVAAGALQNVVSDLRGRI